MNQEPVILYRSADEIILYRSAEEIIYDSVKDNGVMHDKLERCFKSAEIIWSSRLLHASNNAQNHLTM